MGGKGSELHLKYNEIECINTICKIFINSITWFLNLVQYKISIVDMMHFYSVLSVATY